MNQFSKTPVSVDRIVNIELRKIYPQTSRQTKKIFKRSPEPSRDASPSLGDYSPQRLQPRRMESPRTKSTVRVRDLVRDSVRDAIRIEPDSFAASIVLPQDLPVETNENRKGSAPSVIVKNRPNKQGSMDGGLCLSNLSPSLFMSTATGLASHREIREGSLPSFQRKTTSRLSKEVKDSALLSQGRMTRVKLDMNVEAFFKKAEEVYETNKEETKELMQILDVGQRCMSREYGKINRSYNSRPNYMADTFREFKQQQDFKKKLVTKLVDSIVNKEEVLDAMYKHEYFYETPGFVQKAPFRLPEGNLLLP